VQCFSVLILPLKSPTKTSEGIFANQSGNDLVDKIGFGNIFTNSGGHLNRIFITITAEELF
jgi:hypothetical protein